MAIGQTRIGEVLVISRGRITQIWKRVERVGRRLSRHRDTPKSLIDAYIHTRVGSHDIRQLISDPALLEGTLAELHEKHPTMVSFVTELLEDTEMQLDIEESVTEEMMRVRGMSIAALLNEDYRSRVLKHLKRKNTQIDLEFDLAYEMLEGRWAADTEELLKEEKHTNSFNQGTDQDYQGHSTS